MRVSLAIAMLTGAACVRLMHDGTGGARNDRCRSRRGGRGSPRQGSGHRRGSGRCYRNSHSGRMNSDFGRRSAPECPSDLRRQRFESVRRCQAPYVS